MSPTHDHCAPVGARSRAAAQERRDHARWPQQAVGLGAIGPVQPDHARAKQRARAEPDGRAGAGRGIGDQHAQRQAQGRPPIAALQAGEQVAPPLVQLRQDRQREQIELEGGQRPRRHQALAGEIPRGDGRGGRGGAPGVGERAEGLDGAGQWRGHVGP